MLGNNTATLHFSAADTSTPEHGSNQGDLVDPVSSNRPKEILIIEDSPTVRLYLKKVLSYSFPFANIREADDGRAALQELTRGSVQLIVSDLNMPRMDGKLFVQTLRKNSVLRKKPVLLFSSEKPEMSELDQDPLIRFLLKPSDPDAITKAAKDLLAAAATLAH